MAPQMGQQNMYMQHPGQQQGFNPYQQQGFVPRSAGAGGRPPAGAPIYNTGKPSYKGQQYQNVPPHMPVMPQQPGVPMPPQQAFYPPYGQYTVPYGFEQQQQQQQPYFYQQGYPPQQQQQQYRPPVTPQSQAARFTQPPSPLPASFSPAIPTPQTPIMPAMVTPKRTSAIRITNPLTKEEVKLPLGGVGVDATKSATTTPAHAAGALATVPGTPTPAASATMTVPATLGVPVTPVMKEKHGIVLKDAQGHVLSFVKSAKKGGVVETIVAESSPVVMKVLEPVVEKVVEPVVVVEKVEAGKREGSPVRGKSPKRGVSPKREEVVEAVAVVEPVVAVKVRAVSPAPPAKREASPKHAVSPKREASPKRDASPKREASPTREVSPKRAPSPAPRAKTPTPAVPKSTESPALSPRPAAAELEEGEIPSTPAAAPVVTRIQSMHAPPLVAAPIVKAPLPVLKYKITVLTSFETLTYPEGVDAPVSVEEGTASRKFTRAFLLAFKEFDVPPVGLPPIEMFSEEQASGGAGGRGGGRGGSSRNNSFAGPQGSQGGRGGQQRYPSGRGGMQTAGVPQVGRMNSRSEMGGGGGGGRQGRQGSERGGRGRGRGGRGGGGGSYREREEAALADLPYVEPIKATGLGWAPDTLGKKKVIYESEEAAQEAYEAETCKKVKGYLNKLTIEKFDSISTHFLALPITSPSILRKVIALIFDKALDEHYFQNMYGRLCLRLSNELPKIQTWIDMDAKNNIFRRLLLNKCQEEFESSEKWSKEDNAEAESRQERLQRLHSMSSEEKEAYAQDDYARTKLKRRVLGNVTFIGELFKLNMITEKIMHMCVFQLLSEVNNPGEEEVESICKLMKTIGERLDHEKGKPTMDVYFGRIRALSVNMVLSSRIRFMLQDLIELRRNRWKGRIEEVGPVTIAQIHALAEKKAREEEEGRQKSNRGGDRGGRGGRGGDRRDRFDERDERRGSGRGQQDRQMSQRGGGGGGGNNQDARVTTGADGWSTIEKTGRQGSNRGGGGENDGLVNFGRADVKKNVSGMRLGPQSAPWKKEAGGGAAAAAAAAPQAKREEVAKPRNQFSLLSTGHQDEHSEIVSTPVSLMSEDQATKKIEGMVEEWFSIFDVNELVASHKELGTSEYNGKFLLHLVNETFSKKIAVVDKTAEQVLPKLLEAECISSEEVAASLAEVAAALEDISIDIPGAYKHFGSFYGHLMHASDSDFFTLSKLAEILGETIESPMRKPPVPQIVAQALDTIRTATSETAMVRLVANEAFDLQAFWPAAKRSEEVVAAWKVERNLGCLDSEPVDEEEEEEEVEEEEGGDSVENVADV
ncbi:hypothetical protein HDU98_011254 [Podochytrium sp. JEL0797]|nr:hypothetical protein HDU98_011254 [Podochytrium sp. JEL0797]